MKIEAKSGALSWRKFFKFGLSLILIVGVVLVLALPGERTRKYPGREPVKFWHMWSGEWKVVIDRIADRFNQSQDKYEVIALSVPGQSADQKFLMSVTGGDAPDVMAQWNQVIPAWAESGLLMPLDKLMSKAELDELRQAAYPVAMQIGSYKGHLYGVTTGINIHACYFRLDHLAAAGLDPQEFPRNMEGLREWGAKLNHFDAEGNLTRIGFLPEKFNMYAPVFGGGFYDEKAGRVTINTPENLRALTFEFDYRKALGLDHVVRFNSSLNTGGFSTEWPFISGQFSITMDGQWRVEQLAKYAPDLKYGTAPLPPPSGGKALAGFASGNFMLVPKNAAHAEGAWEFIKFWSGIDNPERAAEFYIWGGWLPLTPKIAAAPAYQDYIRKYPQFKTFLDILSSKNIQTAPPVPYQVMLADFIKRAEDFAMRGEKTPKEALDDLEREVAREVARRKRFGL